MAYEHDVFISYKSGDPGEWVNDVFLKPFKRELEGALGRVPTIFLDTAGGIPGGNDWKLSLKNGLAKSRILVGVWTPSYFQSDWCLYECLSMLERSHKYGFLTPANPASLVQAFAISDGEGDTFTRYVGNLQWYKCQDYYYSGGFFINSPKYFEFESNLKNKWIKDVAAGIKAAPQWEQSMYDELPDEPEDIIPVPVTIAAESIRISQPVLGG